MNDDDELEHQIDNYIQSQVDEGLEKIRLARQALRQRISKSLVEEAAWCGISPADLVGDCYGLEIECEGEKFRLTRGGS